jgi:hypothetical protein
VHEDQSGTSLLSPDGPVIPALGQGLAGAAGAAISNIAIYPLDLIITRLQIQRVVRKDQSVSSDSEYKGLFDAACKIYNNEGGLSGFYTGLTSDTGKTIADSFFFFLAYNFFRERRLQARENGKSLPALEELGVGFVAGSLTKLITTPLSNIVTRKQAAAFTASRSPPSSPNPSDTRKAARSKSPSATDIANEILKSQGYLGFWSGYSASLVLTLNPSLTFLLFETFKKLILPRSRRENPPASATFLMAAVSKACASAVTYPFSIAKSRAQSGAKSEEREEKDAMDKDFDSSMKRKAARSTIFSTLLAIAQTEGVSGLYSGLHLEITKGFFSHGLTMIVKQAVHRFVIQIYYMLSLFIQRYKKRANPVSLIERAQRRGHEYYDLGFKRVAEKMEETQRQVKEKANETAEFVAEYVQEDDGEWRDLYGTGLARWLTEK